MPWKQGALPILKLVLVIQWIVLMDTYSTNKITRLVSGLSTPTRSFLCRSRYENHQDNVFQRSARVSRRNDRSRPHRITNRRGDVGAVAAAADDEEVGPQQQQQQQQEQQDPLSLPMTLEGGPATIFAMARRLGTAMLSPNNNDDGSGDGDGDASAASSAPKPLPRWRPNGGVADFNPSFRQRSPAMNSMGYANTIRRNSRKRNKPAMWRYAVRTYDRMAATGKIPQRTAHHEAVLVACSKLGWWRKALDVYRTAERARPEAPTGASSSAARGASSSSSSSGGGASKSGKTSNRRRVTDSMVSSLVSACVRGSRTSLREEQKTSSLDDDVDRRARAIAIAREPLDAARDVLSDLEAAHGIPVVARHVNPLAAAYQRLDAASDAAELVRVRLHRRTVKGDPTDPDRLNIMDLRSKDMGSYNVLVRGAVADRDWRSAVDALEEMTESGLYPNSRCINTWTEVGESGGFRKKRTTRRGEDGESGSNEPASSEVGAVGR